MINWLKKQLPPKHDRKDFYSMDEVMEICEVNDEWRENTLLGKLTVIFWHPPYYFVKNRRWRDVKYWFKPSNVVTVKRHTRWCKWSKPELLFHANFQILNNFYAEEGNCLEKYTKTHWTEEELIKEEENSPNSMGREWCERQMGAYQTLKELHEWYNSTSDDQLSNLLDGYPADYEWGGLETWNDEPKVKYDEKIAKETEAKLTTLVSLRHYMWT